MKFKIMKAVVERTTTTIQDNFIKKLINRSEQLE